MLRGAFVVLLFCVSAVVSIPSGRVLGKASLVSTNTTVHNTTKAYPTHRLPIHISTSDTDLVINGFCFESCRQTTSLLFDRWTWFTSASSALMYRLTFTPVNPNQANAVMVVVGDEVAAKVGWIPPEDAVGEVAKYQAPKIQPMCRKNGETIIRVVVDDPTNTYLPVVFFAKVICSVEPSPGCEELDCGSHGVCEEGSCLCVENYSGSNCTESIFDTCPSQCSGRGVNCVQSKCVCSPGYGGPSCNLNIGCKRWSMCSGHGACIDDIACACERGWTGLSCSETTDAYSQCRTLDYCKSHGNCVIKNNALVCECNPGYHGIDCGQVDGVCPQNCSGHGLCHNGKCHCNFGFKDDDCSTAFSPCGGCMFGTCSEAVDDSNPKCICQPNYTGHHCSIYNSSADPCAALNFCHGHGTCVNGTCACSTGFQGSDCASVAPSGCPKYCSGNGICNFTTNSCVCDATWTGADCATSLCPSKNETVCSGHGACRIQESTHEAACLCGTSFFGSACEHSVCVSNVTCHGHGTCHKVTGVWNKLCECEQGWAGNFCEQTYQPIVVSHLLDADAQPHFIAAESDLDDDFLDTAP
eukprot:c8259_g1_i1.p1 GENE.c8259_g1_i1~~c8259_g1_i1.p1  ORF type:complete len:583 (-),score=125.93 c8259_g1_i1:35-1783(-)